jgi:hypothetical protein
VYYVSTAGVLVHNTYPGNAPDRLGVGNLASPYEKAMVDQARSAESLLGKVPDGKTVAAVPNGSRALSGWGNGADDAVSEAMKLSEAIGHPLRRAGGLDQGVPGRYFSSHAEKQLAAMHPNLPIAVSREMCDVCIPWFRDLARYRNESQVVADPFWVRIFRPDGHIVEIPR